MDLQRGHQSTASQFRRPLCLLQGACTHRCTQSGLSHLPTHLPHPSHTPPTHLPHPSHTPHTHLTHTSPLTHTSDTCPYLEVGLSCQEHAHPLCRGQEAHTGPLRLELTRQQAAQGLAVDVVAKEAVVEVVGVAGLGRHRQGHNLGRGGQQCSGPQPLTTQPSSLATQPSSLTTQPSSLTTQPSPLTTHPSPLTTHPSPHSPHTSSLTTQPSHLTTQPSPLTTQPSPLTPQPSHLIPAKDPSLQTALN